MRNEYALIRKQTCLFMNDTLYIAVDVYTHYFLDSLLYTMDKIFPRFPSV